MPTPAIDIFLDGAIAMAYLIGGLFFLRFWRDTHDRLFLIFAISFGLLGIARLGLTLAGVEEIDRRFYFYLLRLVAFTLILYAILEKNRFFKRGQATPPLKKRSELGDANPPSQS